MIPNFYIFGIIHTLMCICIKYMVPVMGPKYHLGRKQTILSYLYTAIRYIKFSADDFRIISNITGSVITKHNQQMGCCHIFPHSQYVIAAP